MNPEATPAPAQRPLGIDVFCRVVDNFGDAGVCWRLSRQLAQEYGAQVSLWIDRPDILALLDPLALTGSAIRVAHWDEAANGYRPRDVLLSTFGCELPSAVRSQLSPLLRPPLWINLEYLSAEPWIDGCHLLPSVKPGDLATEWFFYPGFSSASGGLLRERGLDAARQRFLDGEAGDWLRARGLGCAPDALRVSLFCYPRAPVGALLAELAANPRRPTHLLVPAGVAEEAVADFLGHRLETGERAQAGALTIVRHSFLDQQDYDRLLWSCDLNFVRGEDSWVRGHWADRPFVWQPYPQSADTHLVKLEAFLERLQAGTAEADETGVADSPGAPRAAPQVALIAAMMRAWSGAAPMAGIAGNFIAELPRLAPCYSRWRRTLSGHPDLANQLYEFISTRI